MQTTQERAKVQAFYYGKIAEGLSIGEAGKLIQMSGGGNVWLDYTGRESILFRHDFQYRIKPETVTHPGGEYPKPCDDVEAIEAQGFAYYPSWGINFEGVPVPEVVKNSVSGPNEIAKCGMYHLTEEAALEHAKVMLSLKY